MDNKSLLIVHKILPFFMQNDIIFPWRNGKMEIKIRKIEKNVADKLTELAKKKGVSRETYIRDYLNTLAVAPELKEMDFKYANLVETLADQARMYADIIDKNNYILDEVLERLDALEQKEGDD
jgi:molybdopterin-guanine dinucleotide biosynthesis protein A